MIEADRRAARFTLENVGDDGTALFENYLTGRSKKPAKLVALGVHSELLKVAKKEKARRLCDYISGMTDAYALRSYKRLLDPDYGSISELI